MPVITKTQYLCYCVAESVKGGSSLYKRGKVVMSDHDLSWLYSVDKHVSNGGEDPAFILLEKKEIEVHYDEPSAEEIAEVSLPILEAGLQKLRADFVVAETRLLADIANIRQLTYKGPLEGDFVAAADSAKEVNPRRDEDAEDAEIVEPAPKWDIDKDGIPF